MDVVSAITVFLDKAEPKCVEWARPEAVGVLRLIADTSEDEEVGRLAKELVDADH